MKSIVIVYEIQENERGLLDERPIFNCDNLEQARVIFKKKWNIDTSNQCLSYCARKNGIFKEKYRIFKIK